MNPSARSTSMPASTGAEAGAGTAGICESNRCRANVASLATALGTSVSAEATIDATRARSGVTSPLPSGCTRFDRKMMNTRVAGSIQIDVPVNPVWPNEPIGRNSPRFDE